MRHSNKLIKTRGCLLSKNDVELTLHCHGFWRLVQFHVFTY